jgi:hypothetical protein
MINLTTVRPGRPFPQAQHHRALDELAAESDRRSQASVWRDGHGASGDPEREDLLPLQ